MSSGTVVSTTSSSSTSPDKTDMSKLRGESLVPGCKNGIRGLLSSVRRRPLGLDLVAVASKDLAASVLSVAFPRYTAERTIHQIVYSRPFLQGLLFWPTRILLFARMILACPVRFARMTARCPFPSQSSSCPCPLPLQGTMVDLVGVVEQTTA